MLPVPLKSSRAAAFWWALLPSSSHLFYPTADQSRRQRCEEGIEQRRWDHLFTISVQELCSRSGNVHHDFVLEYDVDRNRSCNILELQGHLGARTSVQPSVGTPWSEL